MRTLSLLALAGLVLSAVAGCGSKAAEDDGLKLSKSPPPIDQPATGAQPPEVASPKGGNGEGG